MQIDLGADCGGCSKRIYGLVTQGAGTHARWVKTYRVTYSNTYNGTGVSTPSGLAALDSPENAASWTEITVGQYFHGNWDSGSKNYEYFVDRNDLYVSYQHIV
jgi:hypothetical protein